MKSIYERIKELRIERKLSQEDLARMVGYTSRSSVNKVEAGLIDLPQSKILAFAKALNTTPIYLMYGKSTEDTLSESSFSYIHIPVGISAGKLEDCEGLRILPRMSVPDAMMGKYARDPHVVIMHVNGESMNRIIENGAMIAVLTDIQKSQLRNGDIVIACTGPSYTVKRFYNDTENRIVVLSPDSTDPEFVPITIPYDSPEELKIFGKVVMYSVIL